MIRIDIKNIVKSYKQAKQETVVLKDINLTIEPGEFFFLLGPSGCGKTTLLRIICGLLEPTNGSVFFDNQDVTQLASDKRDCAMVFQNYALWPHMTVGKNVEFGPLMQKIEADERKKIAKEKLDIVKMYDLVNRKSNQLSGGQQQRVALARALAANPGCLLLDEPLSNLDARLRAKMRTELRNLVKMTQTTAIYVTHDQDEALSMADRMAVLDAGNIIQVGTPEEIYNQPKTKFVADFIGDANFISGNPKKNSSVISTDIGNINTLHNCSDNLVRINCCIRPERIKIFTDSDTIPERYNIFDCSVQEIAYFGDTCHIEVNLGKGVEWKILCLMDKTIKLQKCQNIKIGVLPGDFIILE